jgi:hypothetical protein
MSEIVVEQAVFGDTGSEALELRARSPHFTDEWIDACTKLCRGFGRPQAGANCPPALFAQPLGRHYVAVVQVSSTDQEGRGALRFHVCVLRENEYAGLGGDPFMVAERCPPTWDASGELRSLTWPRVPFPDRTVEDVRRVLKRPDGPNLLGGCQVLLDGGRLAFERTAPDAQVLRDLWTLLPTRSRAEMWPATFAFSNSLRFHAIVTPPGLRATAPNDFPHYLSEEEAGDYPEDTPGLLSIIPGLQSKERYELRLQRSAEAGDQEGLDILFARRSRTDMWKLGLLILIGMILLPFLVKLFAPPPAGDGSGSSSSVSGSP